MGRLGSGFTDPVIFWQFYAQIVKKKSSYSDFSVVEQSSKVIKL
jgi:hypothetical protein